MWILKKDAIGRFAAHRSEHKSIRSDLRPTRLFTSNLNKPELWTQIKTINDHVLFDLFIYYIDSFLFDVTDTVLK